MSVEQEELAITEEDRPVVVLLDTEYFVRHNFRFGEGELQRIENLVLNGDLGLISTDITQDEITAKFPQLGEEIKKRTKRMLGTPLLPSEIRASLDQLLRSFDVDEVEKAHQAFRERTNTNVLPCNSVDMRQIAEQHRNLSPPFSEKKKNEWKDAAVLQTIEQWAVRNQKKVLVVSEDPDMKRYASESKWVNHSDDMSSLYKLFNPPTADARRFALLVKEKHGDFVQKFIEDEFKTLEFELDCGKEDGSLSDVDLTSLKLGEFKATEIIDAGDGDHVVVVSIEADISVSYTVTFVDYDCEKQPDGGYYSYPCGEYERSFEMQHSCDMQISVHMDEGGKCDKPVFDKQLQIDGDDHLWLVVDDSEEYED